MAGWAVVSHWLAGWGATPAAPFPNLAGTAAVETFTAAADGSSHPSSATVPATVGAATVPGFAAAASGGSASSTARSTSLTATVSTSGVHL